MPFLVDLKNKIFGEITLMTDAEHATEILNICMRKHIAYSDMYTNENSVIFKGSLLFGVRISGMLEAQCVPHKIKVSGLTTVIWRYRKRRGIFIGLVISALILHFSGGVIWDVRVSGNNSVTERQVEEELKAVGFGIGTRIGVRDVDEISNALLATSEDISWLSINIQGTVANVQIREKRKPISENENGYANVIAVRNGTIDRISVRRGNAAVKEGDTVNVGDLLISGLFETNKGGVRYESAQGEVFAVTRRVFDVEIPLEYDDTIVKERKLVKKSLIFFGKSINFYKKNCNSHMFCDTIRRENTLSRFGLTDLPLSVVSEYCEITNNVTLKRSSDDASALAFFELGKRLRAELGDADILSKSITTEICDDAVRLSAVIICSENIAVRAPFEIDLKN